MSIKNDDQIYSAYGITSSSEQTLKDIAHGYMSGVDREGCNIKVAPKEALIEAKLRKADPKCDPCLKRLMEKYGPRSRE